MNYINGPIKETHESRLETQEIAAEGTVLETCEEWDVPSEGNDIDLVLWHGVGPRSLNSGCVKGKFQRSSEKSPGNTAPFI